jgi:asparagine synthase (glutamine-hydrolysing)
MMFGFIHAPETAFENIYQLEPAHYMVVEDAKIRKHCYWSPDYVHTIPRTLDDAKNEYIELLKSCVRDRLVSDVPIGLLLSGGIDSCSIASLMGEMGVDIPAFTIRFGEKDADEGEIASLMAKKVGAHHTELFVQMEDAIKLLPKLVWHYEQPFSDPSAIPSYYVSKLARENVTVALNGDGGDECFGGYWGHIAASWLERFHLFSTLIRRLAKSRFVTNQLRSFDSRSYPLFHTLYLGSQWIGDSDFETAWKWLSSKAKLSELEENNSGLLDRLDPPVLSKLDFYWSEVEGASYLNKILYVSNLKFHLPDDLLTKMDRAAMANSLEVRSPFLDYRMIEFSASLPASWKVRGFVTKWFPKYALRKYLPVEVLAKKKTGFGIPLRQWMKGNLGIFARRTILSDLALSRGFFSKQALINMFDLYETNQIDCSGLLYRLLFLELWFQSYIDDFKPLSFDN